MITRLEAGAYWEVEISGAKGNVLDSALIGALTAVFEEAEDARDLKAICLRGRGAAR